MPAAPKKTTTKKKTAKTAGAGKTAASAGRTTAKGTRTKAAAKRKPDKRVLAKKKQFFSAEVKVIITGLLGLLLFLSNFGVLGAAGDFLSGIETGLFGMVGYVFPVLLILAVVFYVRNQGTFLAEAKLICSLLMIIILSALMQLLFGTTETLSPVQYYAAGAAGELGGGTVGGIIAGLLRGAVGTIGAYLILIALLIICMVFVTERSFVNAAKSGAERTARAAAEGHERAKEAAAAYRERQAERREEERLRREERMARGVDFDAISLDSWKETDEQQLTDEAAMYAGYGRELIGGQPGMEDVDDGTGHGEIHVSGPATSGTQPETDDSRFDTQVLPDPNVFRGKIEGVPDYDDDTVPFDETEESPYKSYRFDTAAENGGKAPVLGLAEAERCGYAAGTSEAQPSRSKEAPKELLAFQRRGEENETRLIGSKDMPEPVYGGGQQEDAAARTDRFSGGYEAAAGVDRSGGSGAAATGIFGGSSFGELSRDNGAAGEDLRPAGSSDGTATLNLSNAVDFPDTSDVPDTFMAPGIADTSGASDILTTSRTLNTSKNSDASVTEAVSPAAHSGRTVTATGKELAGTSFEAAELLRKKLAGEIDRIDTGDEQKPAHLAADGDEEEIAEPRGRQSAGRAQQSGRSFEENGGAEVHGQHGAQRAARGTQQGNVPTDAENRAVAAEIEKKTAVKRPYVFPPLDLLKRGPKAAFTSQQELRETAVKLQQVLRTFGVGVTVTNVSMGPAVTRYELQPDVGVKVSRITSLTDDIKLALAAADIRIEAPIPGKAVVGIEVPNKTKATVYFRDIIDTEEFRSHPSRLAFGIGRDIAGKTVIGDIAKMPHLLIAGATGSGKSVGINTLIMSLIYKSSPEDVRMIMVDPKVVELSVYNGIPHLLIPVVTEPKKAASALNWAVAEMMDRYKKFSETGVRDIKGYNKKAEEVRRLLPADTDEEEVPKKMPQIVIIIDELADLMMVASGEVEDAIVRLTQLARAAGIHLVIATQRPSVNVITGLIKANVPSRIAFQTSSSVDSRTIIDMNGAEKLLGSGDMLYDPSGASKPIRVQGSFISDSEVQAVVDFLTRHGETEYSEEIGNAIEQQSLETSPGQQGGADDSRDEYFAQAGKLIIEKDKASIGMLQRMFKIGFNRAARVMDQLSEAGVVGPEEGTKPRKILMTEAEFEEFLKMS